MNEGYMHQYHPMINGAGTLITMQVSEVSELTGVSVRTLHHYDEIGLLKPSARTESGYRLYNTEDLERLQSILLFRELKFPLKAIKDMLDSPDFDEREALEQQAHLLELEIERLNDLIRLARRAAEYRTNVMVTAQGKTRLIEKQNGEANRYMSFKVFDDSKAEQYRDEVKQRWKDTDAYREYEEREKAGKLPKGFQKEFAEIFRHAGELMRANVSPASEEAAAMVGELQQYITKNFYACSDEILMSLGDMYVSDGRFRENIDMIGGEGTACYVREAIIIAVGKRR